MATVNTASFATVAALTAGSTFAAGAGAGDGAGALPADENEAGETADPAVETARAVAEGETALDAPPPDASAPPVTFRGAIFKAEEKVGSTSVW